MNDVAHKISTQYDLKNHSDFKDSLSNVKVLAFKNGELISKDILKAALGEQKFKEHEKLIMENDDNEIQKR